jgi:hypothetical protein
MQERTKRFLRAYCDTLTSINDPGAAAAVLPAWQVETLPQWQAVCADLNASLGLQGDTQLLAHIPTTYVGSLAGLVVVAANPGWNSRRNRLEHEGRRVSVEHNRAFVRDFFWHYPQVTSGTSGWWTRVLRLKGQARGDAAAMGLPGHELWRHVHISRWAVGGLDLVPFHSARDGVTPVMMRAESEPAQLLREVALQTLRMCLRLKPRLLLIASKSGAELFASLKGELGKMQHQPLAAQKSNLWFDADLYRAAGTRILVLPRQVFSGRCIAPRGYDLSGVASLLRMARSS